MASRRRPLEYSLLLTATMCLLAFGAVMVFSASSAPTVLKGDGDGTGYLFRYVGYGSIGLLGLWAASRCKLALLPRLTGPFLLLCFALLVAVKIPGVGVEKNGASRWLGAGPVQFQPSELMKLALLLYSVKLIAEKPRRTRNPRELAPLGVIALLAFVLVGSQPDLGTVLVMGATLFAILFAAGVPLRFLGTLGGGAALAVFAFAMASPYRRARLLSFMSDTNDATGADFQSMQGEIAVGSGGFLGRGLGESLQKNLFLPEAHTDFILAIVGEELGVLGVMALLFLYGLIAYAGLQVARNARGGYAKLLAAGITSLVLCQGSLNLFAVLGLAPLTGVPLPFVSYGSTNLVVLLAAMGILLNVAAGGKAKLQAVPAGRDARGSKGNGRSAKDPDRGRGDGGARRARAGSRRRAAS